VLIPLRLEKFHWVWRFLRHRHMVVGLITICPRSIKIVAAVMVSG
jgi:hypothetical protein